MMVAQVIEDRVEVTLGVVVEQVVEEAGELA